MLPEWYIDYAEWTISSSWLGAIVATAVTVSVMICTTAPVLMWELRREKRTGKPLLWDGGIASFVGIATAVGVIALHMAALNA